MLLPINSRRNTKENVYLDKPTNTKYLLVGSPPKNTRPSLCSQPAEDAEVNTRPGTDRKLCNAKQSRVLCANAKQGSV